MHVHGVAGGRRSLSLSALPTRGVGALQMFMCVVSVTITYASNTHTRIHAVLTRSNIRWNSLDDHRFFFLSHIRFFHYACRVMILLFWLAAIASFPLLNIQKVPQYIIRSQRVFCFSADSRTMSHCQHCSFHNQDHRGHGPIGRVPHEFQNIDVLESTYVLD